MDCIIGAMLKKKKSKVTKKPSNFEHEKIVTITFSCIITTEHYC